MQTLRQGGNKNGGVEMITNLIATILITVTTNTFAPTQYWQNSDLIFCSDPASSSQSQSGSWENPARIGGSEIIFGDYSNIRPNPDVRITEVHEVKTVSFKCDGIPVRVKLYDKIVSTVTEDRVETTKTATKDGCKVTTTVEQWKRREP